MKNKTKKSPTGAPLGNPLKYFREGGEKTKAMFKKGGYNTPTQELKKAQYGDAGSGMGRMAADDAAFDAMMSQSASQPRMSAPAGMASAVANYSNPNISDVAKSQNNNINAANAANALQGRAAALQKNERINSFLGKQLPKQKKGGSIKNAKLAAVAPPKNKVTRADVLTRILKKKKK
jgi:hypothetical protein